MFIFRKFSFEQRDLDDADEDGNTVYRGLAIPVDIRQVVEVKILINDIFRCDFFSLLGRCLMVVI